MLLSVLRLLLGAVLVLGIEWGKKRLDWQSACPFRGVRPKTKLAHECRDYKLHWVQKRL